MRKSPIVILLVALTACERQELKVAFDIEDVPYGLPVSARPVGTGLTVAVHVIRETGEAFDEEPTHDTIAAEDVRIVALNNATEVDCGSTATQSTCLVAGPGERLEIELDTPFGSVVTERPIRSDLQLAASAPYSGNALSTRLHLQANTTTDLALRFIDSDEQLVSGTAESFDTTGNIAFAGGEAMAGSSGVATIAPVGHPDILPVEIRVVTEAESLASITRFAADRMFTDDPNGRAQLTAYTEGTVGTVRFDGLDLDGFVTLANLPLEVIGGPGVLPRGAPWVTNGFGFLRGELPAGVEQLLSYVEVRAGSATQRIPVQVVRGAY